MKKFNVFYSWQSDLPGNNNRNLLNECIEEAVKESSIIVDGMEIIADRDTKGLTGSPNIPQTIFSKIEECDLFIADVSIINSNMIAESDVDEEGCIDIDGGDAAGRIKEESKPKFRYTPNPNVMIELGYAVRCIGWERVICFINTDYGKIDNLPFDLDHQRVTGYSIQKESKSKVKNNIKSIITHNILILSKQPKLSRMGKANHVIGTFDSLDKSVREELVPLDVRKHDWVETYFEEHRQKAVELINRIKNYHILAVAQMDDYGITSDNNNLQGIEYLKELYGPGVLQNDKIDCHINKNDQESIIALSEKYLKLDRDLMDECFFAVGNLKKQFTTPHIPGIGTIEPSLYGTEDEKAKYKSINELHLQLVEMRWLDLYLKTFDDVFLFPLAIENISAEVDADIEVVIEIEGNCEVINPSVDFIFPELRDVAADIYRMGFPRDLLYMQDDSIIKYEDNEHLYYNQNEPFYGSPLPGYVSNIDADDYQYAIRSYIASPESAERYSFKIKSLRASERKWLGKIIALKKSEYKEMAVKMKYRIISNKTAGDIEGELVYLGENLR